MPNNNNAFEGVSTFDLDPVDLKTARENGFNAVVCTEDESNRIDLSKISGTDDIAPNFSNEDSYHQGDYVYYNGQLYCAKADIDAGNFDQTKWEITQISKNLGSFEVHLGTPGIPGSGTPQIDIRRAYRMGKSLYINDGIYKYPFIVKSMFGEDLVPGYGLSFEFKKNGCDYEGVIIGGSWTINKSHSTIVNPLYNSTATIRPEFRTGIDGLPTLVSDDFKAQYYGPEYSSYMLLGVKAEYDIRLIEGSKLELKFNGYPYIDSSHDIYCSLAVQDMPNPAINHGGYHYFHTISQPLAKRKLYGISNGPLYNISPQSRNPLVFTISESITIEAGSYLYVMLAVSESDFGENPSPFTLFAAPTVAYLSYYDPSNFQQPSFCMMPYGADPHSLIVDGSGIPSNTKFGFLESGSGGTFDANYTQMTRTYAIYTMDSLKILRMIDSEKSVCQNMSVRYLPQFMRLVAIE